MIGILPIIQAAAASTIFKLSVQSLSYGKKRESKPLGIETPKKEKKEKKDDLPYMLG